MKNKYLLFGTAILYLFFILLYLIFIFFKIDNILLKSILIISSVIAVPSFTLYTIIETKKPDELILKKKVPFKKRTFKGNYGAFINDYFEAMPIIDNYATSDDSYEEIPKLHEFIFSLFNPEELDRIELLNLSKMDKIFFLRELLYYNAEERKDLIESMLEAENDEKVVYYPPQMKIGMQDKIRVYVRSLVEPGEKTKILIIESSEFIKELKEKISIFFGYDLDDFLLSTGGILLREDSLVRDYNIDDDDEIALIPRNKK
ncbi:MAG: hypothetical protein EU531_00180 [Promethearchaeota archaeon]|nr:MAG: hypothetical protein EU531_00180 [Candidatus Lokiarchaeota archaeon]